MTTVLQELERLHKKECFTGLVNVVNGRNSAVNLAINLHTQGGVSIGQFHALYMNDEVWEKVVKPALLKAQGMKKGADRNSIIIP